MTDLLIQLPPGTLIILGGLLLPIFPKSTQRYWMLLLPLLSFWHLLLFEQGHVLNLEIFDYVLQPIRVDRLSLVWGYVFHIAAFLSTIYALHVKDNLQHVNGLIYAGSAISAAFSGDLISLFIYWEITAISSVFLIWANRTRESRRAGFRYLVIQVASGVLLLGGTIMHFSATESLEFTKMTFSYRDLAQADPGVFLIFLAFGIKAAFPLLHTWLKESYPEGTVTGTVFLSAFTTKLAIYALARGFPGTDLLIPIGVTMTLFPIFYAVIENDLRRVLAYSLNNQLGFMVVGVGIGTPLALNGTAAHAFAHIIYKALLFMSMGAVLYRAKTIKASELGGLYKSMPWTCVFCIIGSLSISGFPLFSGFVSKSMILTAGGEAHLVWISIALLIASAGVVDHSGIKIPFFSFFAHDSGKRVKEAPLNMLLAMGGAAFLCIAIGVYPDALYRILPYPDLAMEYRKDVFSATHVFTSLQLLLFAALAFVILMRTKIYPPEIRSINLDFGWTYRKAFPAVFKSLGTAADGCFVYVRKVIFGEAGRLNRLLVRFFSPGGVIGEPWSTGRTAFWAALMLALYMVLNFLK